MNKILLVEDDKSFGSLLKNYLKLSGFEVNWVETGTEGYSHFFSDSHYSLCILDVMMPHMDGFSLAKKIRSKNKTIPLLFLTARNQKKDLIEGYESGADDYLTKPFDTDVLLLKIKALLQRTALSSRENLPDQIEFGKFKLERKTRKLTFENKETSKLSPKESMLLELLLQYKNQILPRELALTEIWGESTYFTKRSMDVYITKLRKHLSLDDDIQIETFHQMGFQLNTTSQE